MKAIKTNSGSSSHVAGVCTDFTYKYSREEIVQLVQEELELSRKNYDTAVALSGPGKQSEMGLYFSGKKATYINVLEMLTEVLNDDDNAGEATHIVHPTTLKANSPAFTPQTEPEAQEVI